MKSIQHIVLAGICVCLWACSAHDKAGGPAETATTNPTPTNPAPLVEAGPWDQWAKANPAWVTPIAPYHIIDNLYYVGTQGLGAYLLTSDEGHILLDGGLPQNGPIIIQSIRALGFDEKEVKILLNSHAHFDHSGGLAYLKSVTGAKLHTSKPDRPWLENGFYPGASDQVRYSAPPVKVDRVFQNGDTIKLGPLAMTAQLTPGHSPGCTSWFLTAEHDGTPYEVLIFGSATVAGNRLVPEQYDGIVADYQHTFEKMRHWQPDIILSNHPNFFFDQLDKMTRKQAGDPLAFVDRESFPEQSAALYQKFLKRLEKETHPD